MIKSLKIKLDLTNIKINTTYKSKKLKTGYILSNREGLRFVILGKVEEDYKNRNYKYLIEYIDTGYQSIELGGDILRGYVKDKYFPSIYGIGITGRMPTRNESGEKIREYEIWRHMIQRVTTDKSYKDVKISKEWLYYELFYEDLHNILLPKFNFNMSDYFELDKDMLSNKTNKLYSVDTCALLSKRDNLNVKNPVKIYQLLKNDIVLFEGSINEISNNFKDCTVSGLYNCIYRNKSKYKDYEIKTN